MNNSARETISKALFNIISADLPFTANTHSNTTIDGISERDYQALYYGEEISGPGIQDGTVITDTPVLGTITISLPTTASDTAAILSAHTFKRAVRRLVSPDDIPTERRPFLCLWEYKEEHQRPLGPSAPPLIYLDFMVFCFISTKGTSSSEGIPPMSIVNPIVDAVQLRLDQTRDPATLAQKLGKNSNGFPLCQDCYVEGTIDKRGGDLDGDALAVIPLRVVVPW